METEPQEKPLMLFGENQALTPSSEQLELIGKWLAIFSEHHHKELSTVGAAAYIEGLKDLSPKQIQCGCERALKEVDRMPTIAHIRARIEPPLQDIFTGNPRYPEITQQEREQALEETKEARAELRRKLGLK